MIATICASLAAALKAKGVPFDVVYGPPPIPASVGATRIYVARDYEANEQMQPPRGRFANARMYAVRGVPAVVHIFAKATMDGARRADHERLADQIADEVQVELHKIIRAIPTIYAFTRAGLVADDTTDGWAGVVYEVRFTADRGVRDVSWVGGKAGEMTMTATTAQTALDTTSSPAPTTDLPTATTRIDP
jgi:hypothetical protein